MASIKAWIEVGEIKVWWDFTPPDWSPLPTGQAMENRGFLQNDGGFDGTEARERKVWPTGLYVTETSISETSSGLEVTFVTTEIPQI